MLSLVWILFFSAYLLLVWFDREDLQRIVYQNTLELHAQRHQAYLIAQSQQSVHPQQECVGTDSHPHNCTGTEFSCASDSVNLHSETEGPTSETEETLADGVPVHISFESIFQIDDHVEKEGGGAGADKYNM
jgi:hypothetical protein